MARPVFRAFYQVNKQFYAVFLTTLNSHFVTSNAQTAELHQSNPSAGLVTRIFNIGERKVMGRFHTQAHVLNPVFRIEAAAVQFFDSAYRFPKLYAKRNAFLISSSKTCTLLLSF